MTKTVKVEFPGSQGDMLAARLEMPASPVRAYALFAHCFTCSKDTFAATRIARGLADRDVAVLRFDFTGLGASDGDFANTDFSSNVDDLLCAADWLRKEHAAPAILIGHSLGGAAVLAAAGCVPEASAVATIAAPSDPAHVAHIIAPVRREIEAAGAAEVEIAGRRFRIRKQFLEDIEGQRLAKAVAGMRKPLLIFHAPRDEVVGIENASAIFRAAKHPKSFVSLDDADHLLSRRADAAYVADVLAAWAGRYIGEPDAAAQAAGEPGVVLVRETGEGEFQQEVIVGPHRMLADEPPAVGGADTGPTPYGYLLAALGACTSMTLRMYANRKNWPLDHVSVTLKHQKAHAEDCADCETREGYIDQIDREIEILGPLDTEQRARLLEIADRCPVHRTLHSEVWIRTALKSPA